MVMGNKALVLLHNLLWSLLFSWCHTCYGTESDIQCLQALKEQLNDPDNNLSSWIFSNETEGFICRFTGIECWIPEESRVRYIRLTNMGLQGQFPSALKNCKSLTGLDLSSNNLSGPIPHDIDELVPFVSVLDLSSNGFSGEIPLNLSNCTYLNVVNLTNNQLTGQIPWQLGQLNRLRKFTVAKNSLSGQIPYFLNSFPPQDFDNNLRLCGIPLNPCKINLRKSQTPVIIGSAVGGMLFAALVVSVLLFCMFGVSEKKKEDVKGSKWEMTMKPTKGFEISMFEKSVPKMRLINLMKATNNFNRNNIIGSGRTGTMYRATLSNGSFLAVKRLQEPHHSEKHFISEMMTLGSTRHRNLVPLQGFCIARQERLLVYKYMPEGTLHQHLHQLQSEIKWPMRLRIAMGVARGLAWLHHHCHPCIIHGNISSKCLLLEEHYEPKISDFGFARLMNSDESEGNFCNLGHVDPKSECSSMATPMGDVYSFGMMLLELVSGKRPNKMAIAPQNLKGTLVQRITYLSNCYPIDKSLIEREWHGDLIEVFRVACACVAPASERPTMFEVHKILRVISKKYDMVDEDEILIPAECQYSLSTRIDYHMKCKKFIS